MFLIGAHWVYQEMEFFDLQLQREVEQSSSEAEVCWWEAAVVSSPFDAHQPVGCAACSFEVHQTAFPFDAHYQK